MYENVRQCTTTYDNVQHVATAYSTMYNNVRQKILPYDRIVVAPKRFTCKTFFLIRSIAYENLRLTANNLDTSRQHSNNYYFLIRTLKFVCGRAALDCGSLCWSPTYEFQCATWYELKRRSFSCVVVIYGGFSQ